MVVAPLYGEGRGLKQRRTGHQPKPTAVAPLYGEGRGLKLADPVDEVDADSRSSLWRGAWIETTKCPPIGARRSVAPLYGEGRGLKPTEREISAPPWESLLSMERGVD